MSSTAFEVALPTDRSCRRIVFVSGVVFAAAGMGLIVQMAIDPLFRGLLLCAWLGDSLHGLCRLRQGWRCFDRVRLTASGSVSICLAGGAPVPVECLSGSLVTRRIAWLRFRGPDGRRYAELLLAMRADCLAWHRLQLIWRLGQSAFGHTGPA